MTDPTRAAQHGFRIFPIRPGTKRPAILGWPQGATHDPAQINAWWSNKYADCGIGAAMGASTHGPIFAVDIDVPGGGHQHDGAAAIAALEAIHGPLTPTWTQTTPSGGRHHIYQAPPGVTISNGRGTLPDGIDIRGEGGYIVTYDTLDTTSGNQPSIAPAWLIDIITATPDSSPPPAPVNQYDTPRTTSPHSDDDDAHFATLARHHPAATLLAEAGWTHTHTRGGDDYWARPGKAPSDGHSAVWHGPDGPLVAWTTDLPAGWAPAGRPTGDGNALAFSHFSLYALIRHGGDRTAAAREAHALHGDMTPENDPWAGLIAEHPQHAADGEIGASQGNVDADHTRRMPGHINWATLDATVALEPDWLIRGLIVGGGASHSITAKGGTGKSYAMLALALDMVDAGRTVMYLDFEMTPDVVAQRLHQMGRPAHTVPDTLIYVQPHQTYTLDDIDSANALAAWIALYEPDVIVIDTFARVVGGEENSADTYRAFDRAFGTPLKRAGISLVRLDHTGKDEDRGARGSSAKHDDIDVGWSYDRVGGGWRFKATKRRLAHIPEEVQYSVNAAGSHWTRLEGDEEQVRALLADQRRDDTVEAVIDALDAANAPTDTTRRQARNTYGIQGKNAVIDEACARRAARSITVDQIAPPTIPAADPDGWDPGPTGTGL